MVDLAAFKKNLQKDLEAGRKAFEGKYAAEINELMGLSRADIDAITPGGADLQVYDQLITVVKQASRDNLSEAQLAQNVKALGDIAVAIAKKSKKLAAILV